MGQEKKEAGQHDIRSVIVHSPVGAGQHAQPPGKAMAMVMALAAQQWRRQGGGRGNHDSGRVVVMGIEEGGRWQKY